MELTTIDIHGTSMAKATCQQTLRRTLAK